MRFMAMANVVWASREIEPKDMAPVAKRLTMSLAVSTSSNATGVLAHLLCRLDAEEATQGLQLLVLLVDEAWHIPCTCLAIAAHRMLQCRHRFRWSTHGLHRECAGHSRRPHQAVLTEPGSSQTHLHGARRLLPPLPQGQRLQLCVAVPVKYFFTNSDDKPIASKICAPQ